MATPRAGMHRRPAPTPRRLFGRTLAGALLTSALALPLATWLTARDANAGSLYSEVIGGASIYQSPGTFFGDGTPGSQGFAAGGGIYGTLFELTPGIEGQGGLGARLTSTSDGATHYQLISFTPMFRLQVLNSFVGVGLTPLLWRRTGGIIGIDGISSPDSRLSVTAEFGVLWPVVPIFSLGLSGTAEWVKTADGLGPAPAYTGTVLMRFHLMFLRGGSGGSAESIGSLKGWRYPLGNFR